MTSKDSKTIGPPGRTARAAVLAAGCAFGLSVALGGVLGAQEGGRPVDITHNVVDAPAPVAGAVFGSGTQLHPGQRICTTATQTSANVDTDCEKSGPSNETSITSSG
jgi:hypothetical protein